jgi:hypothetical protein
MTQKWGRALSGEDAVLEKEMMMVQSGLPDFSS